MNDGVKRMGNFGLPDHVANPPKVKSETVDLPSGSVTRGTFQPGWVWSKDAKPTAGTLSCQTHHIFVVLSGNLTCILDDGTEVSMESGAVADIPPGHDARVVGDKPVVLLDFHPKQT